MMFSQTISTQCVGITILIFAVLEGASSADANTTRANECLPAAAGNRTKRSAVSNGPLCEPYQLRFPNGYCKHILGYQPVYGRDVNELLENERKMNEFQIAKNFVLRTRNSTGNIKYQKSIDNSFNVRQSCLDMVDDVYCHHYFKRCYIDTNPQFVCREACTKMFYHDCDREYKIVLKFTEERQNTFYPFYFDIINCTRLPSRNESSQCYTPDKIRDKLDVLESEDCFYGDGRGYRGNKSVTTSGFSCQSWDSQCPHKHNISGHLYQAINNSSNFCRNPGGRAKGGPWCFTTNRTVRWEYCDVPKCPKRPPSSPPVNFHGHNVSATSIFVSWGDVPKPSANGVLLGYHASCKAVKSSDSYFAEFLPEEHHWELKGLKTFANYSCWLRAYNNYGNGSWSEELVISTDDAAPAAPPGYLSARNLSSTSLQVQWDPIPFGFRNGKILQYQVKYSQYSLTRRRVFTTNYAKKRSLTLVNLKKYKKYLIEVSGMTRKGVGPPVSTVVQTDEDVPDRPPSDITVSSLSSKVIKIIWGPVPEDFTNGEILGYRVLYNDTSVAKNTSVSSNQTSVEIHGLKPNTSYNFHVLAFTAKGDGVKSAAYLAKTLSAEKSNSGPSLRSSQGSNAGIIASSVFAGSIAFGAVFLMVFFFRKKRIAAINNDGENGIGCPVTPYAVSSVNWLENVINTQVHGYETIDDDNVPCSNGRPRYINVNPDGSLNLPPHLRDMVIHFEQLYENTSYKQLRRFGRRRSLGGAEDRLGHPIYDKLQRAISSNTPSQSGGCRQQVQATITPTKQHRENHSVDLGELRRFAKDLQSDMEMTEVVSTKTQKRRRHFSVDLGQVREFIALTEINSSAEEENNALTYKPEMKQTNDNEALC